MRDLRDQSGFEAPDLTERIMGRLGYVRIDPVEAQRMRRRRLAGRVAVCAMFLACISAGVHLHSLSDRARVPVEQSIHSAVSGDLRGMVEGLGQTAELVNPLPRAPVVAPRGTPVRFPAADLDDSPPHAEPHQSRVPWSGLL